MSISILAVEFLVIGVYSQGVFSQETLLAPELLFRDSRKHLSLIFRPSLFVRGDCVHKSFDLKYIRVKLKKTSETSKSFQSFESNIGDP